MAIGGANLCLHSFLGAVIHTACDACMGAGLSLYNISPVRLPWRNIAMTAVAVVSIFLIDRLCGLLVGPGDQFYRLVLPPSETARYEFRDFQVLIFRSIGHRV
jgi:hypothetical protein